MLTHEHIFMLFFLAHNIDIFYLNLKKNAFTDVLTTFCTSNDGWVPVDSIRNHSLLVEGELCIWTETKERKIDQLKKIHLNHTFILTNNGYIRPISKPKNTTQMGKVYFKVRIKSTCQSAVVHQQKNMALGLFLFHESNVTWFQA